MFQAMRQMGYGGQKRLQGEVFRKGDFRNDERLLELKYVREVPDKGTYQHCDQCGRDFVNEDYYRSHFLEVHSPQPPEPPPPTKMEDAFPGGLVQDMRSGAVRAGRA